MCILYEMFTLKNTFSNDEEWKCVSWLLVDVDLPSADELSVMDIVSCIQQDMHIDILILNIYYILLYTIYLYIIYTYIYLYIFIIYLYIVYVYINIV